MLLYKTKWSIAVFNLAALQNDRLEKKKPKNATREKFENF